MLSIVIFLYGNFLDRYQLSKAGNIIKKITLNSSISYSYTFYVTLNKNTYNDDKDLLNEAFERRLGYCHNYSLYIEPHKEVAHYDIINNILNKYQYDYYIFMDSNENIINVKDAITYLKANHNVGIYQNQISNIITTLAISNKHYIFYKDINTDMTHTAYVLWLNTIYKDITLDTHKQLNLTKPILIVCNGPSASKIDWTWLNKNRDKVDVFCMNSMYKKFDELQFYPDYYASLDNVVIKSHLDSIKYWLNRRVIKKIFLIKQTICNIESRFTVIKKKPGLQNVSDNIHEFRSWGNTGADAVQLAIMMGYKDIYIIGVDGYTEQINESECTINNTLIVKETPQTNPNYWFASYQEKDEEYNFPNVKDVHIPGWNHAAKICRKININLYNLSDNKDYIKSISFMDYKDFVMLIDNN